jgi:hypothetical protein
MNMDVEYWDIPMYCTIENVKFLHDDEQACDVYELCFFLFVHRIPAWLVLLRRRHVRLPTPSHKLDLGWRMCL